MVGKLARGERLLVMLSWISHLRSIMVTRDWMWYIYCVCLEKNTYLRQALTNAWIAAIMTIGGLTIDKGWLAILSWVSYLRSMMCIYSIVLLWREVHTVQWFCYQIINNWDPEVGWVLNFSQKNNCSRNQNNS